jgi:hypothetical protein
LKVHAKQVCANEQVAAAAAAAAVQDLIDSRTLS